MGERWINREAVEWVMYESQVKRGQFPVLLVVASHADVNGRGAYPAAGTVAQLTRQSRRQVIRDLLVLVDEEHLLPGDPRLVAHIRPDRRPQVYDLPDAYRLWTTRVRGDNLSPRDGRRGDKRAPDGVTNATGRGDRLSPEEVLKTSGKGARAGAQPPAAPAATHAEPTRNGAPICRTCGNRLDSAYHRNVCREDA